MASKKITELTDLATPVGADVLPIVDDVAGTPTTKKVTATNLMSLAPVQSVNGDTGAVTVSGLSLSTTSPTASGTPLAYTLTSGEDGKVILFNETNNVYVTVPTGLGSGFNCKFVQMGAGKIILEAGSGATLNSYQPGSQLLSTTIGQYAEIELIPVGTNSFVVVGNSTFAPFINTYSISFDGVDDVVTLGNIDEIESVTDISFSWWATSSAASTGTDTVFANSSQTTKFAIKSAGVLFRINNVTNTLGSANYNDSTFRHFVFTLASGTGTLYVNGSSVGSASNYGTTTSSTAGASATIGGGHTGNVDEFGIWNSALSASEVTEIYNSGTPTSLLVDTGNYTSSSNLQHYWRCGDSDGGGGTNLSDIGNASITVDGTLTNGASFVTNVP